MPNLVLSFLVGVMMPLLMGITTDQIWQNIYDSSNTALRVNVVAGGSTPSGAAGGDLSGTYPNPTVAKVNGTSVNTNSAADQLVRTTASATATWVNIGSCSAASSALTYNTTTHAFGCNTITSGLVVGTTAITSGTSGRILYDNAGVLGELTVPLSVANGGTGLASGTDGGILGYTASGTLASSAALTANTLIKGGGAGATPVVSSITETAGAIGWYPAAAAPQAVTETYASVVTGTTDTAGAATTTKLSASTGSGVGGTWTIQNTNKAGTGNTPNTYGTVLSLSPPNTGTTAPVNYLDLKNAITGSPPQLSALGSDSNIDIQLAPKGSGLIATQSDSAGPTTWLKLYRSDRARNIYIAPINSTQGLELGSGNFAAMLQLGNGSAPDAVIGTVSAGSAQTVALGKASNTAATQSLKAASAVSGNNSGSDLKLLGGDKAGSGQDGAPVLGKGYAITNLPTGRTQGARAFVTDQITACPAIGAAPTAGGAIVCPVFFDGTNWVGG